MWFVYAMSAAVIWGVSYAASGRAIERGVSPVTFFFLYSVAGAALGLVSLAATRRLAAVPSEIRGLGADWVWLAIAVVTSAIGSLLIYLAIGKKNATVASLIEISYPFFVALFAWLFFRQAQAGVPTIIGGVLVLAGVAIIFVTTK